MTFNRQIKNDPVFKQKTGSNARSKRLISLLFVFGLVAAACGTVETTVEGAVEEVVDAVGEAAPTAPEDDSPPVQQANVPVEIDGPKETFQPGLAGPFNLDGGITFDAAAADVIIDEAPNQLSERYTAWPTDWTRRTVDSFDEFFAGLPASDPRDGIPPLDSPIFETVSFASEWLAPNEPGALVQLNGEVRFYPLSIMTAHEIVNDAFGDVPVTVTYCPLCNTALAFDRRVNGEVLDFGVSGLLRNSDLVMWDRQTTSLWQQITGEGVVGQFAGAQLELVPTSIVSFEQFASSFPEGLSLAAESGRGRSSYGDNPYQGYSSSDRPFLFNEEVDPRLPALSRVVGVTQGDGLAAYSFERLAEEQVVNDEVGGVPVVVFHGGATNDALDGRVIARSEEIGTGVAHDPVVDGQTLTFTANGDATFTDDQTGSTWSIVGIATDGELAGTQLGPIEHRNEFWFVWAAFFGPDNLRDA